MSVVETKIEGISGDDKICTIFPYEILAVIEEPEPTPTPTPTPTEPTDGLQRAIQAIIDFIKKILNIL